LHILQLTFEKLIEKSRFSLSPTPLNHPFFADSATGSFTLSPFLKKMDDAGKAAKPVAETANQGIANAKFNYK